jgi:hypothetical protein
MAMVITLVSVEDGLCKVEIKPEVGNAYHRDFSKAALEEYVESAKEYCSHKGYDFIYNNNHGGKREGAGRPALGTTKKVSLTLADEIWEKLEEYQEKESYRKYSICRSQVTY